MSRNSGGSETRYSPDKLGQLILPEKSGEMLQKMADDFSR